MATFFSVTSLLTSAIESVVTTLASLPSNLTEDALLKASSIKLVAWAFSFCFSSFDFG